MKRRVAGVALGVLLIGLSLVVLVPRSTPSPQQRGDSTAAAPREAARDAAQPAAPVISLRLNGLAPRTEPFVLTAGEPVLVEFQLCHPDPRARDAIHLEPPAGSWAQRAKIVVTDGQGTTGPWPFVVTGRPSGGGLSLQPSAVTTLVLRLGEQGRAAVAPGSYRMVARLDLPDGRGYRGTLDSEPVNIKVVPASTAADGESLARRQLLRVRDALLGGDLAGAETAAMQLQRAAPRRPEGFIAMALVQEAKGERSAAIRSVEFAISRATGGSPNGHTWESGTAATGPAHPVMQPPKPAPVEYYELLRRIQRLPVEGGAEKSGGGCCPWGFYASGPCRGRRCRPACSFLSQYCAVTTTVPVRPINSLVFLSLWQGAFGNSQAMLDALPS